MYKPKQAYDLKVIPENESGYCAVQFYETPDELTIHVFQAMGFRKFKNSNTLIAEDQELILSQEFAELMQESLKVGEYPEYIPYESQFFPDEANIRTSKFGIVTILFKNSKGVIDREDRLIFEKSAIRKDGFANIIATDRHGDSLESLSVSDYRPSKKDGGKLFTATDYDTTFPEPFGTYSNKQNTIQKSTIPEKEEETAEEIVLPKEDTQKSDTQKSDTQKSDTQKSDTQNLPLNTGNQEDSILKISGLNEKSVTQKSASHKSDTQISEAHFDEEQLKANYKLLSKLIPDLIPQIDRGVNYSESLSSNSDFQKVIFKVIGEVENDLLDITLELIPKKDSQFHYHQLTIRLNLIEKECLMTEWLTTKDKKTKNRNIPTYGLSSLLNKLLSQEHWFALSEEAIPETQPQKRTTKEGIAALKQILLKEGKEFTTYEGFEVFHSWEEGNEKLSQFDFQSEEDHPIFYIIEWENGEKIGAYFNLFTEGFYPDYQEDLLQKVAVRHYLKNLYHSEGRYKSSIPNPEKASKSDYLNALIGLDCGEKMAEFVAAFRPKIPLTTLYVSSKTKLDLNTNQSIRPFDHAVRILTLTKATSSPNETVNFNLHWRDGLKLSTEIKVNSIPKTITKQFWKMLLKSKTSVEEVEQYQFHDDEPLLFDHEINFKIPDFYFTALESAYWHRADKDTKNKLFFSGYLYHKKHLAKTIQNYLNKMTEEDENELIQLANKSIRQKRVLDFILEYKKLEKKDHNLQYAQIIQLIEEAIKKKVENSKTALDGLLLKFQNEGTMVSLPQSRKQNTAAKAKAPKESKRIEHNREIEKLLEEKGNDYLQYSDKELQLLNTYSGYGGSKLSEVNKGLLYEYYTPDDIVRYMWGFAIKHGYQSGAVLEPSCGIGKFLKYVPKGSRIEAYETNKYSAQIAQLLYPQAKIHHKSFEQLFFNGNIYLKGKFRTKPFDLVIGNPPYGSFSGKFAGMGERKRTKAFTYDQYFLTKGLDLLVSGGLLVYIIPQNFLDNNSKYNPLKERIAAKAEFIEARRLPHGIFEHTEVGTDIIVFRKK